MIPRVGGHSNRFKIHGGGQSFKGAGLYYLHDKDKASTSNRVAFTHTENLPTDDPEKALRFMAYTAMRAEELKAQAGGAKTGRKRQKTVYTYSLSWHPEEKITPAEMIEAARETMKILKIHDREALLVAHNDEAYPHIHVIVNRVSPENGIAAPLSNDWNKLSRWAQRYEKQRGKIYCDQRVANNNRRAKGEYVKYRPEFDTVDYRKWKRARNEELRLRGPSLEINVPQYHRAQRQALHDTKEKTILQRRQQIRETARPKWAFLFKQQRAEALELDATRKSAVKRLLYWLSHRQEIKARGGLVGAFHAMLGYHGPDFLDAMNKRHLEDRQALARTVNKQIREAIAQEKGQYQIDLKALKLNQAEELETFRDGEESRRQEAEWQRDQAEEQQGSAEEQEDRKRDADWRRIERREKPVKEQFEERVRKRIRKARRRDGRGKGKDHGRERED